MVNYFWPGNIRQLKNIAEQISIIEKNREINSDTLLKYLPQYSSSNVPSLRGDVNSASAGFDASDREIIFKVLRDYRGELNELKKVVYDLVSAAGKSTVLGAGEGVQIINQPYGDVVPATGNTGSITLHQPVMHNTGVPAQHVIEVEETLSLQDKEIDMIRKALRKHKGKRKSAAKELGISERTLYRKINEYTIED